jgi:hypothetical protein
MPEEAVVSHSACDPAEHKRMKSLEQMILNGDRGVENFAATRRSRTGDLLITKQRANIQYVEISRTAEKTSTRSGFHGSVAFVWKHAGNKLLAWFALALTAIETVHGLRDPHLRSESRLHAK